MSVPLVRQVATEAVAFPTAQRRDARATTAWDEWEEPEDTSSSRTRPLPELAVAFPTSLAVEEADQAARVEFPSGWEEGEAVDPNDFVEVRGDEVGDFVEGWGGEDRDAAPASGAGADTASTITNASSVSVEEENERTPLTLRKHKRAFLLEGDFPFDEDEDEDLYEDNEEEYTRTCIYRGPSGLFAAHEGKFITFQSLDHQGYGMGRGWVNIGYWNATLEGWVIPPKNKELIEEMMVVKEKED